MFDFDFLSLVVAVAALIFARKAFNQAASLRARLDVLETTGLRTTAGKTEPSPLAAAPIRTASPIQEWVHGETTEEAAPPFQSTWPPPLPDDPSTASPAAGGPGFEERIGTRWVVWVGGLTLALGGLFMVRYSIDAGLIAPGVRILLGGLFALALLAAGEWTRRKEDIAAIALPLANIPAILTAAGTAVAFATIYSSYAFYGFLVPATAFILLGMVALGTLAAALLHGPALAGLGIAAGFITPLLVSSTEPDYWALYVYLAVVTAAAFGLARIRLWRWLAVATIVLATLWTLPCLECGPSMIAPHEFHVIAGFILAALLVVCGFMFGPPDEDGRIEPISSGSLAAYLLGATLIVLTSFHADAAITGFALLVAATLFVAWRAPAATGAVAAAAAFVAIVFLEWAVRANPDMLTLPGGPMPGIGADAIGGSVSLHLTAAAFFAVGFGAIGFLTQGRSANATVSVLWAAAAVFTPLALLVALYARIAHLDRSIPFAILAVILGIAFAAATEALPRRDNRPGMPISVALFATGTLSALALALTFALEKGWLTIALSLMSLGTAWISMQRPIPFLRSLAAILAYIVVLRIGYEPRIVGDAVGTTPIFNWLLWGYGIPALSFWMASIFMRRHGDDAPLRSVEAAAILFTVLLVFLEIRHVVYNGDIYHEFPEQLEIALDVCAELAMAIGLERLRLRTGSAVHNFSATVVTGFAGVGAIGLLTLELPTLTAIRLDGVFFNPLLLAYAIPAILALVLSHVVAGQRPVAYANTIAAAALALALGYISLEIRRLYHGPDLTAGITSNAEQYTYSIAWLAFGVILLGIGVVFNSQRARLASAVVIALTILKAFLIDMSVLTGVYRALSFMCLGLVLVAIGWLYQRILFRRQVAVLGTAFQPEG